MIALIKKLYANDVIRYIFFGGCTTVVNLASFFFLRQAGLQREIANVISVILAICLCGKLQICFSGQMRNLEGPHPAFLQVRRSQTEHHGHRGWRSMVFRRDRTFK